MSASRLVFRLLILLALLSLAACVPASAFAPASPTAGAVNGTRLPKAVNLQTSTPASSPGDTPQPSPSATARLTRTSSPVYTPIVCEKLACVIQASFPLTRPIQPPGRDSVEPSYRFGSTQDGRREPHHGVEFVNRAGTPVLAAADGLVVVAGRDDQASFADMVDFYGRLVVIKHDIPGVAQPVFTLYGHLLEISVQVGERVAAGEEIGQVGVGGVAAGTHLHFEVRLGENSYHATRNPELWLQPHTGADGLLNAALAGRILDDAGELLAIDNIVVKRLGEDGEPLAVIYTSTYAAGEMVDQLPYHESFALGDLLPGQYRISFVYKRMLQYEVRLEPGKLTLVNLPGE